jgi:membrane dipeptidase
MIQNVVESKITAMYLTVSGETFNAAVQRTARWLDNTASNPTIFLQVRTLTDLNDAKSSGRMGLVFGFQDTTPYEGDIDNIQVFHQMGVRVVQLTYNVRNLVGDGCLESGNAGLSSYGNQVVERLNELGSIIDLSHCGQRTTAEGIQASSSPVAISHSACNAIARHPRGKDDAELRAMADKGGVMGIYLMPFLTPGGVPLTDDVIRHIEHALSVCGEDHVGIGSDLSVTPIGGDDGYRAKHKEFVAERISRGTAAPSEDPDILFTVPELDSPNRMRLIADELHAGGHSDRIIEKILGRNWIRLMQDVWKS